MEMRPTRQLTGKRCEAGQKARPSHCHMLLLGDPLQNTKPAAEGEEGREGPVPGTHHAQGGGGAEPGTGAGLKAGGSDNRANGDYSITTSLHNDGRHYPASKHIKQTTAELKPEVGGPQTQLEVAQCPGNQAGRVPGKHEGLENPPDHCDLSRARERATAHTPQPRCHPTFVAGPGLGQTRVPTGSCYWRPAAYLPDAKLTTE